MSDLFSGQEVLLQDMLDAREQRAFRQLTLLKSQKNISLLSMTMNIPGPIKTSVKLEHVFESMIEQVQGCLGQSLEQKLLKQKTGWEYYALTELAPRKLKEKMIELESVSPQGRLFDLDVLWLDKNVQPQSISRRDLGYPARSCYVCQDDAKACGRMRKHSIAEMQEAIAVIIATA